MIISETQLRDLIQEELIKYLIEEGILEEGYLSELPGKLGKWGRGAALGAGLAAGGLSGIAAAPSTAHAAPEKPGVSQTYQAKKADRDLYAGPAWGVSSTKEAMQEKIASGELDEAAADVVRDIWSDAFVKVHRTNPLAGTPGHPTALEHAEKVGMKALEELVQAGTYQATHPVEKPAEGPRKFETGDPIGRAMNALLKGTDVIEQQMTTDGFSAEQISKTLDLVNAGDSEGAQAYLASLR
jgi:hypothetical protein